MIPRALGLVLLLSACAAPDSKGDAGMRRVSELPERYRATWVAWVEQDPEWPQLREQALRDDKLASFLVDNLARVMLRNYRAGVIASVDSPELGPFERARTELVRIGAPAVPTLAELMAIGDGTAADLCRQLLVEIGRPALAYTTAMLGRESAQERARAAQVLGELPHAGDGEGELQATLGALLQDDPDWLVRMTSAEALGRRGARDVETATSRAALSRGLADEDPEVARAAAFGLARLGDPAAVPALLNYLERTERAADLVSYEACQRALRSLTGATEPRRPREWRDWWRANRAERAGDRDGRGNR